mmetsp:Transcript_49757/g.116969  ORF Transcript_49757/g.116969 Transcript_49757/m.116969 type:complete len:254 (-) Transcript_49757:120-881(-)
MVSCTVWRCTVTFPPLMEHATERLDERVSDQMSTARSVENATNLASPGFMGSRSASPRNVPSSNTVMGPPSRDSPVVLVRSTAENGCCLFFSGLKCRTRCACVAADTMGTIADWFAAMDTVWSISYLKRSPTSSVFAPTARELTPPASSSSLLSPRSISTMFDTICCCICICCGIICCICCCGIALRNLDALSIGRRRSNPSSSRSRLRRVILLLLYSGVRRSWSILCGSPVMRTSLMSSQSSSPMLSTMAQP